MLKHGSDKCQSDSTTQAIYISFNFSSYGKLKALWTAWDGFKWAATCPVWSESWLPAWRNLGSLATHWAHSEDWADAQADPSLRWAHTHFFGFCHIVSQMEILSLFSSMSPLLSRDCAVWMTPKSLPVLTFNTVIIFVKNYCDLDFGTR